MEKWQEIVDLFVLHQKAQGLSKRTIEDSKYHIIFNSSLTGPNSEAAEGLSTHRLHCRSCYHYKCCTNSKIYGIIIYIDNGKQFLLVYLYPIGGS